MTSEAGVSRLRAISVTRLDSVDIKILALLQQDPTMSSSDIAERVFLSQSPCWRRISIMQKCGLFRKQIVLNRELLGLSLMVHVLVHLIDQGRPKVKEFESAVNALDEVHNCYKMVGDVDYMLTVVVKDLAAYDTFLEQTLSRLPGIGELNSKLVLSEIKSSKKLSLDNLLEMAV